MSDTTLPVSDDLRLTLDFVDADLALPQLLAVAGAVARGADSDPVERLLAVDVTTDALSKDVVLAIAERLAMHPRVREFSVRDDSGAWNLDDSAADSLHLAVVYRDADAREWAVSVRFRAPLPGHVVRSA